MSNSSPVVPDPHAAPQNSPLAPMPWAPAPGVADNRGQVAPYGYPPTPYNASTIGQIRGTGITILLSIVTLGIYSLVWYYKVHEEMKRHTGVGLGGGIALLIALLVGVVMPYLTSAEVGELYERRGQPKPVSGVTGLWYLPGALILIGPIIWFVKTNGALNAYWRSVGAR